MKAPPYLRFRGHLQRGPLLVRSKRLSVLFVLRSAWLPALWVGDQLFRLGSPRVRKPKRLAGDSRGLEGSAARKPGSRR